MALVTVLSVLIAPDSFKGTLTAREVGGALAEGWRSERPHDVLSVVPLADGGEGTLDAVEASQPGAERRDAGLVAGPDGRPVKGEWLRLPDGTAVIELARTSGLPLMRNLDALGATTFGLGEVIRSALAHGAQRLVIGLGGSASTDGGAGALAALGLEAVGGSLRRGGGGLADIRSLDRSRLLTAPTGGVILLTDVDSPLLGAHGAAAIFGPQKGASAHQVESLDSALGTFASLLGGDPTLAGSGAAGGTGYGISAAWGATIHPGAAWLMQLASIDERIRKADVVLTGEGCFDATSTAGKLVGELTARASAAGAAVGIVAGSILEQPRSQSGADLWARALTDLAGSVDAAMAEPARWLRLAGAAAARSALALSRQ